MSVISVGVLEDDQPQAELLKIWLTRAGYKVFCCDTGERFLQWVRDNTPDILILDWQLPDCEGIDILVKLRQSLGFSGPVMFTTARNSEEDVVRGLHNGADDYLIKPLRQAELLARLTTLWRRMAKDTPEKHVLGPIEFDITNKRVLVQNTQVTLTPIEFQLAVCVCSNVGKLLSREYLLREVWGVDANIDTRTVDMHISRIRKLLKISPDMGYCIKTIYRHGYRLEAL